jgi:hypothetical protein
MAFERWHLHWSSQAVGHSRGHQCVSRAPLPSLLAGDATPVWQAVESMSRCLAPLSLMPFKSGSRFDLIFLAFLAPTLPGSFFTPLSGFPGLEGGWAKSFILHRQSSLPRLGCCVGYLTPAHSRLHPPHSLVLPTVLIGFSEWKGPTSHRGVAWELSVSPNEGKKWLHSSSSPSLFQQLLGHSYLFAITVSDSLSLQKDFEQKQGDKDWTCSHQLWCVASELTSYLPMQHSSTQGWCVWSGIGGEDLEPPWLKDVNSFNVGTASWFSVIFSFLGKQTSCI